MQPLWERPWNNVGKPKHKVGGDIHTQDVASHPGNGRGATERGLWHDRVNPHDHHDQVVCFFYRHVSFLVFRAGGEVAGSTGQLIPSTQV